MHPMIRLRQGVLGAMLLSLPLSGAAQAQAVALRAESLVAHVHDSVVSWQERAHRPAGLVEVVAMDGHIVVDLRAVFDAPWTDTLDQLRANARDIRLRLPDGSEREMVGSQSYWGQYTLRDSSLSGRRPRDFPDEQGDIHWNGLFMVPAGTPSVTLVIGGDAVSFEQSVPLGKASVPRDAASYASFAIEQVRRLRRVNLEDGRDADLARSHITAPAGHVLAEVRIEVTAIEGNEADGDARFSWQTHDFRLVDDQGRTLGLVGERFLRRILDSQFNGVNVGDDAERTVLWLVPESLASARLLYGETEVATVALNAQILDTD